jgi:prepilin-type processing-associated H-X9-DG protein
MDLVAKSATQGQRSPHVGGFQALMADGSVRFISNTIDPNTLRTLLLRQRFNGNAEQTFEPAAEVPGNMAANNPTQRPADGSKNNGHPATNNVNKSPKSPEDFAALVSDLDSGDFSRRTRATRQLLRAKPSEPNAAVAKALERVLVEERNTTIRVRAALALANWGTAQSIPALQEAAQKDPDPMVRSRAAKAIEAVKQRQ